MSNTAVGDEKSADQWAWSAWTVWRGDLRLLAHVARVAHEVVEGTGSSASLCIKVFAKGDCEEFSSARDFLQEVTPQAVRRFTKLTISALGENAAAEVLMARKDLYEPPFNGTWGIVIRTRASSGEASTESDRAKAMCERLRIAVRRGSPPWSRGFTRTETGSQATIEEKLRRLGGRRTHLTSAFVRMLTSLPFLVGSLLFPGVVDDGELGGEVYYLAASQSLILLLGPPLAARILPAIEIAELTPLRRMLRLIGSAALSGATGVALAFARAEMGLPG